MNQSELNKIMHEIDQIINQLADCQFCQHSIDQESRKLLSELFRMKIEQACRIKKAS